MNALVTYGSSDEDEEHIQPEKPSKVQKTAPSATSPVDAKLPSNAFPTTTPEEAPVLVTKSTVQAGQENVEPGPAAGPSMDPAPLMSNQRNPASPDDVDSAPLSPYTYERQRLRELSMPTVPNFVIPDSPGPPAKNSEEAAVLAATSKKFERFLDLKKQGVHFNERLQNSASLRNPSLLPKLMEFAGVSSEESYASSLPEGLAVPVKWPEECYVESLIKSNERREKKRLAQRERVDFVSASTSANHTATAEGQEPH